ncbi:MAG: hypothetical protein PHG65_10005 [Kiritimatiellae bacterium]|nr:hypothetical protein [Kiritimatiellia bacterium]
MEWPQHADEYRSWLMWAGAGVLGLLGLGLWSLLDPIGFPGPSPELDYPRVAYRPVLTRGNDLGHGGALQSVWTPILFSLPTRAGFSSLFLEQPGDSLPPAGLPKVAAQEPARLPQNWDAYQTEAANADITTQIRYARWRNLRQAGRASAAPASALPSGGLFSEPSVRWMGDLSAEMMLESTVNLKGLGGGVRDVVLSVEVLEDGLFDQVFVEQSSGDVEWDNLVAVRVKQWRAAPSGTKRRGRLEVQSGSYGPVALPGGEGVP